MEQLASNLMAHARGLGVVDDDSVPTSSLRSLNTSPLRVGLWPLVSDEAPEIAMGLMAVLGLLLERWPFILVYRLFVRAEGDPAAYRWQLADSQFDVDDWQLDYLDENVAIWGRLVESGSTLTLTLNVESDLSPDDDVQTLTYISPDLASLVERLPVIAGEIAAMLDAGPVGPITVAADDAGMQPEALSDLLRAMFHWERDLLLLLWNALPEDFDAETRVASLRDMAATVGGDFGGWAFVSLARRALRPATRPTYESALAGRWADVIAQFQDSPAAVLLAAQARFGEGQEAEAVRDLQRAASQWPDRVDLRLGLAELYRRSGNAQEMIDTLQQAIEDDVTSASLFFIYGGLLASLRQSGLVINRFALIDARDRQLERMVEEAAAAYEAGLELEPQRADMLQRLVLMLVDLGDERLWPSFERLVELDKTGEQVRGVVESFTLLEDFAEGIDVLEAAVAAHPDRADLRVNLAMALLLADEPDAAGEQLEQAQELTDDSPLMAEIERLFLAVDDPEFEIRLGEITELVEAGKGLPQRDIAYLEDAIDNAPLFLAPYLLLARAFINQNQADRALEVLLDAQQNLPDEPEVIELLARLLWDSGEKDLALDYLNNGLAVHPDDVPLLALAGRYLFEQEQDAEARALLARAESLNPRNRVLREVQSFIARQLD